MGCLDNGHEHGRADRTQGRNRTEQFPSLVLLALGDEFLPRLLAQENQCVELLVVKLGPETHASLGDLAKPFLAMALVVDTLTTTWNARTAIDRLDPVHDSCELFADRLIGTSN